METAIAITIPQILGVLSVLAGVISFLFYALIGAKDAANKLALADRDKAIERLEAQQESHEKLAEEAVRTAREIANYYRVRAGETPVPSLAAVVPESQSPPTREQRQDAALATMRATMASIKLAENMPPRKESK